MQNSIIKVCNNHEKFSVDSYVRFGVVEKVSDAALANLRNLLDKRETLQKDELIKAITRSKRSYEEVLAFLDTGDESEAD